MSERNTPDWVIWLARWFDGSRLYASPATVWVEHGVIARIANGMQRSDTTPVLDLTDRLIAPGLVDAHVHLFLTRPIAPPDERKAAQSLPFAELLAEARTALAATAHAGVVVVRDLGDNRGINLALRGSSPVRVIAAGPAINRPGRYGSFLSVPLADGDSREAVQERRAAGSDVLKVIVSSAIDFAAETVKGSPQFTPLELRQMVELAHADGLSVAVHASGVRGIEVAVAAGVDTIEHGYFVTESQLERMAAAEIAWVPTLVPVWSQWRWAEACGWDVTVQEKLARILAGHVAAIRRAHQLGVSILAGSDAGSPMVPHGTGLLRELQLLRDAGLSPETVLGAATGIAAARLRLDSHLGRIEPGAPARFAALAIGDGGPIESRGELIDLVGTGPSTDRPIGYVERLQQDGLITAEREAGVVVWRWHRDLRGNAQSGGVFRGYSG